MQIFFIFFLLGILLAPARADAMSRFRRLGGTASLIGKRFLGTSMRDPYGGLRGVRCYREKTFNDVLRETGFLRKAINDEDTSAALKAVEKGANIWTINADTTYLFDSLDKLLKDKLEQNGCFTADEVAIADIIGWQSFEGKSPEDFYVKDEE